MLRISRERGSRDLRPSPPRESGLRLSRFAGLASGPGGKAWSMTKKPERVPGMRATSPNRRLRRHPEQVEDQPLSRDGLHAEPFENAVADLRMALHDEPLRLVERGGLAQDLLGNRELADVVQAAREPRELDLRLVDAEPARDSCGQLADAFRVTPRV